LGTNRVYPERGRLLPVAINIKNERTVSLARELAQLRGTTLTSAIEEAIEARLKDVRTETSYEERARAERLADILDSVAELHARITDDERAALRRANEDLYDELGLPSGR